MEDIFVQAINDSTYEHPCLSYIVDIANPIWPNYFSSEKFNEVRASELPAVEDEIQNCINLYDQEAP